MDLGNHTSEIQYEDSALGRMEKARAEESDKQIAELRRIADAAQRQADLAVQQAKEAQEKAKEYEKQSRKSARVAVSSAIGTFLMWFFTRDEAISLIRKGLELLSQGLKQLWTG